MGKYICPLFPDAADVPGVRVMAKADNGPGRMNPDLQRHLRATGWSMFAQTPNGTEETQECDQLYAFLKTVAYRNRDKLYRARQEANPDDTSPLSMTDVGYIVFGGIVALQDGSTVELEDAFSAAFDRSHVLRACEKCGYLPSTRAVLKSTKLRHEVVMLTRAEEADSSDSSDDDSWYVVGCLLFIASSLHIINTLDALLFLLVQHCGR